MPQRNTSLPLAAIPMEVRYLERDGEASGAASGGSIGGKAAKFEIVFTAGARVMRIDWENNRRYWEELVVSEAAVDLSRLKRGAPLLDTHSGWRLSDTLGVVENPKIEGGRGTAEATFSRRPEVAGVVQDVKDGILRNVSVGYSRDRVERIAPVKEGDLWVYRVTRWTPHEVSIVPMPADMDAQVKGEKREHERSFPCEIIELEARGLSAAPSNGDPMDEEEKRRIAEEARQAERARAADIRNRCKQARLPEAFAQRLIDENVSGGDIATRVLDAVVERQGPEIRSVHRGASNDGAESIERALRAGERGDTDTNGWPVLGYGSGDIRGLRDMRDGMIDRIVAMQCGFVAKPSVAARDFDGKTIMAMARHWHAAVTGRSLASVERVSGMEVAQETLGTRGGNSTSDFPNVLTSGTQRSLRQLYEMKPPTFEPIVRRVTLPDFRAVDRIAFSNMASLQKVVEGGEYNYGTFTEGKVSYSMAKFGNVYGFTWESFVNDDLGAFQRLPRQINQMIRQLQSKIVYDLLALNSGTGPIMPDTFALFSTQHANLQSTAAAFGAASLNAGRVLMGTKLDPSGKDYMNLDAEFLLVNNSRQTDAEQLIASGTVIKTTTNDRESPNNKWYSALQLIVDPRIPANAYILATSPNQVDTIEFAELEGESGPVLLTQEGFDVDEWKLKVRYVCGAAVIDHYGFVRHVLT